MELIQLVATWVWENVALLLQVVGAFAILATRTPNKVDDKIMQGVMDVVNFVGMNTGKAKNV